MSSRGSKKWTSSGGGNREPAIPRWVARPLPSFLECARHAGEWRADGFNEKGSFWKRNTHRSQRGPQNGPDKPVYGPVRTTWMPVNGMKHPTASISFDSDAQNPRYYLRRYDDPPCGPKCLQHIVKQLPEGRFGICPRHERVIPHPKPPPEMEVAQPGTFVRCTVLRTISPIFFYVRKVFDVAKLETLEKMFEKEEAMIVKHVLSYPVQGGYAVCRYKGRLHRCLVNTITMEANQVDLIDIGCSAIIRHEELYTMPTDFASFSAPLSFKCSLIDQDSDLWDFKATSAFNELITNAGVITLEIDGEVTDDGKHLVRLIYPSLPENIFTERPKQHRRKFQREFYDNPDGEVEEVFDEFTSPVVGFRNSDEESDGEDRKFFARGRGDQRHGEYRRYFGTVLSNSLTSPRSNYSSESYSKVPKFVYVEPEDSELEEWEPDPDIGFTPGLPNRRKGWPVNEMFRANERLGVRSSFYNVNVYSTAVPTGGRAARRRAEAIARQIEASAVSIYREMLEDDVYEYEMDKEAYLVAFRDLAETHAQLPKEHTREKFNPFREKSPCRNQKENGIKDNMKNGQVDRLDVAKVGDEKPRNLKPFPRTTSYSSANNRQEPTRVWRRKEAASKPIEEPKKLSILERARQLVEFSDDEYGPHDAWEERRKESLDQVQQVDVQYRGSSSDSEGTLEDQHNDVMRTNACPIGLVRPENHEYTREREDSDSTPHEQGSVQGQKDVEHHEQQIPPGFEQFYTQGDQQQPFAEEYYAQESQQPLQPTLLDFSPVQIAPSPHQYQITSGYYQQPQPIYPMSPTPQYVTMSPMSMQPQPYQLPMNQMVYAQQPMMQPYVHHQQFFIPYQTQQMPYPMPIPQPSPLYPDQPYAQPSQYPNQQQW